MALSAVTEIIDKDPTKTITASFQTIVTQNGILASDETEDVVIPRQTDSQRIHTFLQLPMVAEGDPITVNVRISEWREW